MTIELTVDGVMALRPCYKRGRVEELFGDRDSVTLREALADERIPIADRIWLGLSVPGPHVRPSLDRIVGRVVEAHALYCGVPAVEAWAARWLSGEDRSREAATRTAAWAASEEVEAAVVAASEAASREAASAAAWAARAVWEAASAWAAPAAAAERRRQLGDLRACLETM